MALTEKVRKRLEGKKFDKLFMDNEKTWRELCRDARNIIKPLIAGGEPTVDDIRSILLPLIELHEHYTKFMGENPRLTQQFWAKDFTDYVLHRVYQPKLTIPQP
jgi:hypothetical protein